MKKLWVCILVLSSLSTNSFAKKIYMPEKSNGDGGQYRVLYRFSSSDNGELKFGLYKGLSVEPRKGIHPVATNLDSDGFFENADFWSFVASRECYENDMSKHAIVDENHTLKRALSMIVAHTAVKNDIDPKNMIMDIEVEVYPSYSILKNLISSSSQSDRYEVLSVRIEKCSSHSKVLNVFLDDLTKRAASFTRSHQIDRTSTAPRNDAMAR